MSLRAPPLLRPPDEPLRAGEVVLRVPEARDVAALVRHGEHADVAATVWVPVPCPCSESVARARIEEFRRGWREPTTFGAALAIAGASDDALVGAVFLRGRPEAAVELGYGVAPEWRGRGIATAAVRCVAAWCLAEGAPRVELRISSGHEASRRVAEKAGFAYVTTERTRVPGTDEEYDDTLYVRSA